MSVLYTAVERFDATAGERWTKFVAWSGLSQLREVISLDGILCPNFFLGRLSDQDWRHNIDEDFKIHFFRDLDYVLARVGDNMRVNVLAVVQSPPGSGLDSFSDPRFVFRGFDLLEVNGGDISALLNCGGFPKAFANTELSDCGLLTNHERTMSVQHVLRQEYPDEHHADCDIWTIWTMNR
jgi:hypothetical protein